MSETSDNADDTTPVLTDYDTARGLDLARAWATSLGDRTFLTADCRSHPHLYAVLAGDDVTVGHVRLFALQRLSTRQPFPLDWARARLAASDVQGADGCATLIGRVLDALEQARAVHRPEDPARTTDGCAWCNDAGCCPRQAWPCACLRSLLLPGELWAAAATTP